MLPPSRCPEPGSLLCQPKEACRNIPVRISNNWGSLGTSCVEAPRVPLEEYQSYKRKKGQGPWQIWARPHVFHGQVWSRGQEDQRRERIDAWGPVCTAVGANSGSPQEQGPFSLQAGKLAIRHHHCSHSRPQELGPPDARGPFSILSFSVLVFLIGINGTHSQGYDVNACKVHGAPGRHC